VVGVIGMMGVVVVSDVSGVVAIEGSFYNQITRELKSNRDQPVYLDNTFGFMCKGAFRCREPLHYFICRSVFTDT